MMQNLNENSLSFQNNETAGTATSLLFESYGVVILIETTTRDCMDRVTGYLPPGWRAVQARPWDLRYALFKKKDNGQALEESTYQLFRGAEKLAENPSLTFILETLDSDLRINMGLLTPDKLFVHAGVVGVKGKAIVIPGRSYSGKTTLVASLVKAGAVYYSDEYAIFDRMGRLEAYPRRLSVRDAEGRTTRQCAVKDLGGIVGTESISIGMIIHTTYQPGCQWNPKQLSPGEALLALLDNTIVAQTKPAFALSILSDVASSAPAFSGPRGNADEMSCQLLKFL